MQVTLLTLPVSVTSGRYFCCSLPRCHICKKGWQVVNGVCLSCLPRCSPDYLLSVTSPTRQCAPRRAGLAARPLQAGEVLGRGSAPPRRPALGWHVLLMCWFSSKLTVLGSGSGPVQRGAHVSHWLCGHRLQRLQDLAVQLLQRGLLEGPREPGWWGQALFPLPRVAHGAGVC